MNKADPPPANADAETASRGHTPTKRLLDNSLLVWVGAFVLTLAGFYAVDHFIMAIQGLPLNLDLTPAQRAVRVP